ncbi:MAG TPA: AI-2E family transporter [Gemmatimonadaceae bacterium]|nr:AI-2E family transporter [Gemmatimonadaceae bacterium]
MAETAIQSRALGLRVLTVVLVAAVGLLLLPYISGLIGAAVLYVVARPVVRRLDPSRRSRAVPLAAVIAMFFLLVVPGVWLLAELVAQVPHVIRSFQDGAAIERLMVLEVGDIRVGALLRQLSAEVVAWSSRQTMTALAEGMNATLNLVVALFGAYYLLVSGDSIWERVRPLLPFGAATSELLRTRFHRTTEAMLIGVVLTGAAQGTLVSLVFWGIGLPHPLLWGGVTAFASVLPMFGSALVWFPASLLLLAQDRYLAAGALVVFGALIVSNIDNALRLVVYRRVSQIHPMVTLVGAFAGVGAFGIAGVLIGPLLLSYVIELVQLARAPDLPILAEAA